MYCLLLFYIFDFALVLNVTVMAMSYLSI